MRRARLARHSCTSPSPASSPAPSPCSSGAQGACWRAVGSAAIVGTSALSKFAELLLQLLDPTAVSHTEPQVNFRVR
eukprot:2201083-Prymnesium_polylepis.2